MLNRKIQKIGGFKTNKTKKIFLETKYMNEVVDFNSFKLRHPNEIMTK